MYLWKEKQTGELKVAEWMPVWWVRVTINEKGEVSEVKTETTSG